MATEYEPYDGDYIEADYTKLIDDIQREQGIDIGAWLEICVSLDDDEIYITCSNDEGNEWERSYTFPIPPGWEPEAVRAMFEGYVYLQTDAYQSVDCSENEEE